MKSKIQNQKFKIGLALLLIMGGCGYDHGIDPNPYRIKGAIIFHEPPPWYASEARLAIVKKLPPENFTTDLILSDPLPFSRDPSRTGPDTVHYELVANAGTYPIAGVLWREQGKGWAIENILGIYGVVIDIFHPKFTPQEIVIPPDQPVADSVDIDAYWFFAIERDANIAGTITLHGNWPQDTDFFILGAYAEVPKTPLEFVTGLLSGRAPFQLILRRTPVNSFGYNIGVNSAINAGNYKFLALFWKGTNASLTDIKAIGLYHCPTDSLCPEGPSKLVPLTVKVKKDSTSSGVDFDADFSLVNGVLDYCKVEVDCPSDSRGVLFSSGRRR